MPGMVIRALEKNTYTWAFGQVPLNTTITIPVAVNVDSSRFAYCGVAMRLHSFSLGGATGGSPAVYASVVASAPTNEDPAAVFRGSTVITGANKLLLASLAAPAVQTEFSSANAMGAFVDVLLNVTMPTTIGNANLYVVVSIDLTLKS